MQANFEFNIEGFRNEVNALCDKDVDFLSAVLTVCERNDIELETISSIIKKDPELKSRMFLVAEKLNFLKKTLPELPDLEEEE